MRFAWLPRFWFAGRESHTSMQRLRFVSLISLIYDVSVGVLLLAAREWLARTFSVPAPQPPIFVEMCGLFMIAIGIGYVMPYLRPGGARGYLWVMGPVLKGAGAIVFVVDHLVHGSPASFLLFAATDGTLAVLTLWALLTTPGPRRDTVVS